MNTIIDSKTADKQSIDEILSVLDCDKNGLAQSQVQKRLKIWGENSLDEKKTNPFLLFLKGFWGPIPWLIEAAAVMSVIVHHWTDFIVIIVLLLSNAIIEFVEEYSADTAISQLKSKLALNALALRDGQWKTVAASKLVPGDVITVKFGDIVPADIKLFEGDYLTIDQSALTGESLTVDKKTGDIAYSGTAAKQGKMSGIVINTAKNTLFGQTANLIDEAKNVSSYQKAVIKIGNVLIVVALILIVLLGIIETIRGEDLIDFISFALVLLVAAIPAALPTVLSVTMVVGIKKLSKENAIVSHMTAVEEMSGMDILCSDKTGTLTQNRLSIRQFVPYGGQTTETLLQNAVLASDQTEKDDAIDQLVKQTWHMHFPDSDVLNAYSQTKYIPFDPVNKRTEATYTHNATSLTVTKGAPQAITALLDDAQAQKFITDNALSFAEKGFRTLAVAEKNDGTWKLNGVFSMFDPPRDDSAATIAEARKLGVTVKMITGDQVSIASETATEIGLGSHILNAEKLDGLSDDEAEKMVEEANGFAQVFPEHKFRIVKLLQDKQHIVGMTGDGVNDAPALKQANIGIAVDGATDVSKSAADLILTDKGISVIIDAIRESRKIFARMENYTIYRIAETFRILMFITICMIVLKFYPITALMIVLLAILNDLSILTIAYDNVKVAQEPKNWNMKYIILQASILGIIGVIFSFACIFIADRFLGLSLEQLQTLVYLKLSLGGHLAVFLARNKYHFYDSAPAKPLWISVLVTQTLAILFSVYGIILPVGIGWANAAFVIAFVTIAFFVSDFLRAIIIRKIEKIPAEKNPQ